MDQILTWFAQNGKWVFSGIGVLAISLLLGRIAVRKNSQVIKGNSSGIQAGRDVKITNDREKH